MNRRLAGFVPLLITCCSLHALADPMDWPNWRGPHQNNTSTETGLVDEWDPDGGEGSNLLWKRDDLGGRCTPIVMNGKLYTVVRDQLASPTEGAKVVCADAATGETIWEHSYTVYLTDVPDSRVGWAPVCGDPETGRVYALDVCGYFVCLEGDTGKVVWERSLHEEFGLLSTYGGRTHAPLVFEDNVIVSAVIIGWGDTPEWGNLAKPAHRFLCFNKASGKLRWLRGTSISPSDTTYSTATITTLGGQAAMVFGSGYGEIWALQPRTGEPIWHYPLSRRGINVSPLVVGDTVYASQSEENVVGNTMGSLVALDGTMKGDLAGKEKWLEVQDMSGKSSPIKVHGKLLTIDDRAKLYFFDPETGERLAKKALGTVMRSTPLYADGKIYCSTANGRWYILKPTEKGVKILHRLRLGSGNDGSPIVSHGRIYLPMSDALYCIGNEDTAKDPKKTNSSSISTPAQDTKPAQVQLVPYDILLAPGESMKFDARVYNAHGQLLETKTDVVTVDAPPVGTAKHTASLVTAKVGDLTGTARVRIVPALPWKFDFNDGEKVPLTWVGGRVRWVPREVAGEKIAVKRSVLPTPKDPNNKLGTRSQMFMGSPEMSNYTIQADFALQQDEGSGKMSDLGLINSHYTMTVRSANKKLRVYSWSPSDFRAYAEVDFDPEPGRWYTMKLEVIPQGSKAVVRGKLWPRGEEEPSAWTVQFTDPRPNVEGSPGLYGHASEAEIFLDNVSVTANK